MAGKATKSWVGKLPSDMSDEELREAKSALAEQVGPAQDRLNFLSAAVGQLDREINERFRMTSGVVPANALPVSPLDAIVSEYQTTAD